MKNKPASFALRALAFTTETSYGLLLTSMFISLIVSQPTLASAAYALFIFLILFALNPLVIYSSVILTYYFDGSLGKLLTGLRVTDEHGGRLSFKRVAFRQTIGYSFSGLLVGLGFVSVAKDPKKQGWHDKAVGSQVIVKQNLWPLALIVCIASIGGTIYFGTIAWERVTTGPFRAEYQMLRQQIIDATIAEQRQKDIDAILTPSPSATLYK